MGIQGSFMGRLALDGASARPTPGGRHGAACTAAPSAVDPGEGARLRADNGKRPGATER